jgi:hypothetical protein
VTGRDFGGQRFRSTPEIRVGGGRDVILGAVQIAYLDCAHDHARTKERWDLVKRVICRDKVLIQLESLILAQSERWRQA